MSGPGAPAVVDEGRPWPERVEFLLLMTVGAVALAHVLGFASARTVVLVVGPVLAVDCVAYIGSVIREDEYRPQLVALFATLCAAAAVAWIAFGGAGPRWLEALLLLAFVIFVASKALGSDEEGGRGMPHDRPPPY